MTVTVFFKYAQSMGEWDIIENVYRISNVGGVLYFERDGDNVSFRADALSSFQVSF